MNDQFYNDLELIKADPEQIKAYESNVNTVVIAGPGSGKTKVLTLKAITLAKSYIQKPSGIACISFSRETVRELKKRLISYGYTPTTRDFIGTVHSFSWRHVLEPFAHLYPQYRVKYPVKILPYEISHQLYQGVLKSLGKEMQAKVSLTDINKHRSLSIAGRSAVQINSTPLIAQAASIYQARLDETDYIDFTDVINISARIIREQKFVRLSLQNKFPWILVDEYQDLGKALHEIVLELIFNAEMKLYAVGDVNQSIYGFNGGYPDFLLELTQSDDIRTIHLEANYRSSQHIIDASLEALQPPAPFPKYKAKKRKDDVANFSFITCEEGMEDQYREVSKKIIPDLTAKGIALKEISIITSSNEQIQHMSRFLEIEGIPFYMRNWKFENSAVLTWLQDCAKWSADKDKQSFEELFNFWVRMIIVHNNYRKGWQDIRLKTFFYSSLNDSRRYHTVYEWVNYLITALELDTLLLSSEIYPNEVENMRLLLDEARLHNLKNASLGRFANLGIPEDEVTITTRHSCKGLEFEAVILLGMEEEHFPSYYHLQNQLELAEDQRLCYVCISRAKSICILIRSKFFTIPTRNGSWRKQFAPSRYWMSLYDKFRSKEDSNDNIKKLM
jgi:DNA helicase-2/ATP-dependent DNA helicase PcrA